MSWKEEAWEKFLKEKWDKRDREKEYVEYTKEDLYPILNKYDQSGQGEIRIFHSGHTKLKAVQKRGVMEFPVSRTRWVLVKAPPALDFFDPEVKSKFQPYRELTEGMKVALKRAGDRGATPGETTLVHIAKHVGVIENFYGVENGGVIFTGGRQNADCEIIVGDKVLDFTKAQIEIDAGYEWPEMAILVEVKSSLRQKDFEINQALLPWLKWKKLLNNKVVYSMVLLSQLKDGLLTYHCYDLQPDQSTSPFGMQISRSSKYILELSDLVSGATE